MSKSFAETRIDVLEIEREARAMRAEVMAGAGRALRGWLASLFVRVPARRHA